MITPEVQPANVVQARHPWAVSAAVSPCSGNLLLDDSANPDSKHSFNQAGLPLTKPLCPLPSAASVLFSPRRTSVLLIYHEWHPQRPLLPQAASLLASSTPLQAAPGTPRIPCFLFWSLRQEVAWDTKVNSTLPNPVQVSCAPTSGSLLELHPGQGPRKLTIRAGLSCYPRNIKYTHTHTPDCHDNLALVSCIQYRKSHKV